MQLFYNSKLDNTVTEFFFSPEESKHISRVLRKKEGDILEITNGKGQMFSAKILEAHAEKCKAQIVETQHCTPSNYVLHIGIAPTKQNDRFEWFLEKATEIGIARITPLLCDHSERKSIKPERLEKVLQAAMKQSLQAYLPQLRPLTPLKEFLTTTSADIKFIAHCSKGEKAELKRKLQPDKEVLILIGPEGDFSEKEIDAALQQGYSAVSLGQNRLRTETAAIVACTAVAIVNS
ncbi:MAG: 16S rRNA (uracil(1498)-N(3))-methyltransferase [Bacteroidota bacterium]